MLLLSGKRLRQLLDVKRDTRTVFVAGVQRSGTNMLMDVLERSYETDVYHERDSRAFENYQMRPQSVIRDLYEGTRASHFIIKTLCELNRLNDLMRDFTPSRTVWIVRNYEDVVNSMLVSFGNQSSQVKRIAQDITSDGWLSEGMSAATHTLLREHVHDKIDDASACALIWYFRNIHFFELGLDTNPDVMLVRYEDLVTNPKNEFSRIFAFLELKYTARVSRKVVASSIRKRPSPPIEEGVREVCEHLSSCFAQACGR